MSVETLNLNAWPSQKTKRSTQITIWVTRQQIVRKADSKSYKTQEKRLCLEKTMAKAPGLVDLSTSSPSVVYQRLSNIFILFSFRCEHCLRNKSSLFCRATMFLG
jgi:hypothetical protein